MPPYPVFGYTGPYKNRGALDMVIQGMSGLMSLTGEPKRQANKMRNLRQ